MNLSRRLSALEATQKPICRATLTESDMTTMATLEGAVIAAHLGNWQPGKGGFACLYTGLRNVDLYGFDHRTATAREFFLRFQGGVFQACHRAGLSTVSHPRTWDRTRAAFDLIGNGRADLWNSLHGILERHPCLNLRIPEIRDKADEPSTSCGYQGTEFTPVLSEQSQSPYSNPHWRP